MNLTLGFIDDLLAIKRAHSRPRGCQPSAQRRHLLHRHRLGLRAPAPVSAGGALPSAPLQPGVAPLALLEAHLMQQERER